MENKEGQVATYRHNSGDSWVEVDVKIKRHWKGTGGDNYIVEPLADSVTLSSDRVRALKFNENTE